MVIALSSSKIKILILSFVTILFLSHNLCSQSNNPDFQRAEENYQKKNYDKAIKYYKKVLVNEPYNYDVNHKLAICYFNLAQYQESDSYYQKLLTDYEKIDPVIYIEYGELQMKLGQPELARNYFMKYNNLMENNDLNSFQYQKTIENDEKFFDDSACYTIKPIDFNSPANEQNPILYQHKLLYETDQLFYDQNKEFNSIYYKNDDENGSGRPSIVEGKAATKYKGKGFTINRVNNELIISKLQVSHRDSTFELFSSQFDDNFKLFSDEKLIPLDIFEGNILYPALSPDGNCLVFSSDKGTLNHSYDLFVSYRGESGFNQPRLVPGVINTLNNELYPYFLNDSILFFSSDGHGGLGGLDIYYINLKSPNSLPVNIGYPLNSEFDETGICFSDNEFEGYISSNRLGNSTNDIFLFKIINMRALGLVIDEENGKNLRDVLIEVQNIDGSGSIQTLADNGNFTLFCKPGERYNIAVSKAGYKTKQYQISASGKSFSGINTLDMGIFSIQPDTVPSIKPEIPISVYQQSEIIAEPAMEDVAEEYKEPLVEAVPETKVLPQVVEPDTNSILFRVQIAACRRQMSNTELKKLYNGDKSILMFQEENWFKYYIGAYESYYEANYMCRKSNVRGSFVVAYRGDQKLVLRDAIREKNVNRLLKEVSKTDVIDQPKIASVSIYYPYNEYQPINKELNKLIKLIEQVKNNPEYYIEIFGYVDKQGNNLYNIGLALERSKYIRNYLIEKSLDPDKIFLRSVRQIDINTKALVKNDPENRKVEVVVVK